MPFQLIQCMVNIGGENHTVVLVEPPVTYAEFLVMKHIHGDTAVTEPCSVGEIDRSPEEERARLKGKYGDELINEVYPGAMVRLPQGATDIPTLEEVLNIRRAVEKAKATAAQKNAAKRTKPVPTSPVTNGTVLLDGLEDDVSDVDLTSEG